MMAQTKTKRLFTAALVVPSAPVGEHTDLDALTDQVWQDIFGVNVLGAFYCIRAAMPLLKASKYLSQIAEALSAMPDVVLLDTVGELGAAWGLADVGYTGGSLDGVRGGQSMIEPAGYGVPTVFGPHVWNFRDAARRLVDAGGAAMVNDEAELERELAALVENADRRRRMGDAARALAREQQGATERTLDVIDRLARIFPRTENPRDSTPV